MLTCSFDFTAADVSPFSYFCTPCDILNTCLTKDRLPTYALCGNDTPAILMDINALTLPTLFDGTVANILEAAWSGNTLQRVDNAKCQIATCGFGAVNPETNTQTTCLAYVCAGEICHLFLNLHRNMPRETSSISTRKEKSCNSSWNQISTSDMYVVSWKSTGQTHELCVARLENHRALLGHMRCLLVDNYCLLGSPQWRQLQLRSMLQPPGQHPLYGVYTSQPQVRKSSAGGCPRICGKIQ